MESAPFWIVRDWTLEDCEQHFLENLPLESSCLCAFFDTSSWSDPLSDTRAPYSAQHHQTQHRSHNYTAQTCRVILSVAKRTKNTDTRCETFRVWRILGEVVVVCDAVLEVWPPFWPVVIAPVVDLLSGARVCPQPHHRNLGACARHCGQFAPLCCASLLCEFFPK